MADLTADEVLDVLRAIERGEITVTPNVDPSEQYCGNVLCTTSNGWEFLVFNDCDEWDYIDTVTAPDGRSAHLWSFLDDGAFEAACAMPRETEEQSNARFSAVDAARNADGMGAVRDYSPPGDGYQWGVVDARGGNRG